MSTVRTGRSADEVEVFATAFAQLPELVAYSDSARRVLAVAAAPVPARRGSGHVGA